MTNVRRIDPELHFPIGFVFEVPDQFNGNQRGTWYFRSIYNDALIGPFKHEAEAEFHKMRDHDCA